MIQDLKFKNKYIFFLVFSLLPPSYFLLLPSVARAVCPICTVAVGAGLGLSRYLGIDDAVSSIWIGGLILSSSLWLTDWLKKRFVHLRGEIGSHLGYYVTAFMYLIVLVPLWFSKVIGHPYNTILGIDKILFGTTLGSIMFLVGIWADKKVRKTKAKQLFQYQKVVFPVVSLVLTSLLLYYYGGYLY
ncbi:hypothetical protein A2962_04220 [Candidatus Woesebacteria bacterium RIFCSPLOWO2_01_FULL_39_61]|uniref:Uncharacterized protein n=1 Tax=Candidatus Woesebacteria bacterium RIFCSPHIGHO2_02_FULL_39_13 TaxID=1802505 RepID=A0A1F7YZR5_9BACT|nr:MAG: hypothetical protein A2692_05215 [Candidatus Woesebacteria bacterium RIFCSPHIGHO2_01_FULL_39_95]OGM32168.1 MAG: hypothetical protein A3D01_02160 [Candidatus Woesebacteria bacterium RIFCSPHIGHO2_02_FULL_39_13]OGM36537.1 MAG: hypothetical protein A3E13_04275 [Candidatus Woesebacteria bacterium RIFCSPHIGHO2_12_FULL_40_20]OGM65958.1 MAG: hypothetical protein A2962_04220 [Candidatus Woesebacteria bacterium RIFCSPLOWO2_01_FULL_39_61]OGM71400.1 MAG: hypothetical protein A3H19_04510 [Candidatus